MDLVWSNMRRNYKYEWGSPRMLFWKHGLWSISPHLTHMGWQLLDVTYRRACIGTIAFRSRQLSWISERSSFYTTSEIRYQCHDCCQIWLLLCSIVIMNFSAFFSVPWLRDLWFSIILFSTAESSVLFHCLLLTLLHFGVWDQMFWLFHVIVRTSLYFYQFLKDLLCYLKL